MDLSPAKGRVLLGLDENGIMVSWLLSNSETSEDKVPLLSTPNAKDSVESEPPQIVAKSS